MRDDAVVLASVRPSAQEICARHKQESNWLKEVLEEARRSVDSWPPELRKIYGLPEVPPKRA